MRVLLLADTHIGFDLPRRARIDRRRRGHDFMANFERALQPAHDGVVDLVVHGGDLLYRSKVPPSLVDAAIEPLARVAAAGVPVFIVPGNHERSAIPRTLLTAQARLHVFAEPGTVLCDVRGARVAVAGFPFVREAARDFTSLVASTGHDDVAADVRLLCVHLVFEGARVGPADYTFRSGPGVVAGRHVPGGLAAVLSGHIHRSQILRRDLSGNVLACPVVYPGSVERTSFAEAAEPKGFMVLTVAPGPVAGGTLTDASFQSLPARPMVAVEFGDGAPDAVAALDRLRENLAALAPDSVVRVRNGPGVLPQVAAALTAPRLRALAPPTMNVELAAPPRLQGSPGAPRRSPETKFAARRS